MTEPGAPAVLLGGAVNALAAARSLGREGVQVHVLPEGASSPAEHSRYTRSCAGIERGDVQQQWFAWLEKAPPNAVLLPCSDNGLELIARRRADLVAMGHLPVEANDQLVLACLDKVETYEVAQRAGIEAPRVARLQGDDSVDQIAATFVFPVAVKAVHSHRAPAAFRSKGEVARDVDELRALMRLAGDTPVLVTEIVPGEDDSFCSYYTYIADGEALLHFTKKKLRQYPIHFGTGTYHVGEWVPEAAELGEKLFRASELVGLGNVEFKRDRRDGRLKLIECNLRLTAAEPMLRAAGLDLPYLLYRRALGVRVEPVGEVRRASRQWHPVADTRAFLAYRSEGSLTTGDWLGSLAHRTALPFFSRDDLRPSVSIAAQTIRMSIGKRLR